MEGIYSLGVLIMNEEEIKLAQGHRYAHQETN